MADSFKDVQHKSHSWARASTDKSSPDNYIISYLDGTFRSMCRPGQLPGQLGYNRWQEFCYAGHKYDHGPN